MITLALSFFPWVPGSEELSAANRSGAEIAKGKSKRGMITRQGDAVRPQKSSEFAVGGAEVYARA